MKKAVLAILIAVSFQVSIAQTFNEWFRQGKTQRKYLLEQIAAFKMYLGYVQKGYKVASKGLTTIGEIKRGDFNLHDAFFSSLQNVNPVIRKYAKVADIILLHKSILKLYLQAYHYVRTDGMYSSKEIDFIQKVFTNLINSCGNDVDELLAIISADRLEMTDDERLERIDSIYNAVQD